ncbi:MAG: SDR family oxidoreductase [Burkholderiaceae bacterium]|nr:SDR family oxidoreductase [Burkholderiaceae bacterium]
MKTVLIVGASRGIGLEFARQYAAAGHRVLATHRRSEDGARLRALGAQALALDVLDAGSRAAFVQALAEERIDIAILSAGIYGPKTEGVEPPDPAEFDRVMRTNVLAPMALMPALAPLMVAPGGKLAVLSSRMGSTTLMNSTYGWLYRASKAALNNALKAASLAFAARGLVCIAFHPGWVRTDMGGPDADLDVTESVASMRDVLARANGSHNGKFLNYNGEHLAW